MSSNQFTASNPYNRLCEWKDVTNQFHQAAKALATGQIIKSEKLSLFDAMTAVEIGDIRMDSGMDQMKNGGLEKVGQELAIALDLLTMYFLWLKNGYSLGQTVFTCKHLHAIVNAPSKLKPVLLGIVKLVHLTKVFVDYPDTAIEEDVMTDSLGFSLCEAVEVVDLTGGLDACKDELKPVGQMIKFLLLLMNNLIVYVKDGGKVDRILKLIQEIDQISLPETDEDASNAFDPEINRKRYTPAPPRPGVKDLDRKFAISSLHEWITLIPEILAVRGKNPNLPSILKFVDYTSRRSLDPVLRNLLVLTCVNHDKLLDKTPMTLAIKESGEKLYGLPKHKPQAFLEEASLNMFDWINCYKYNPSRTRRLLAKVIFYLETLQAHTDEWDADLQKAGKVPVDSLVFSSWVYHHKLDVISRWFSFGFELDLWAKYEFVQVYWYWNQILDGHVAHVRRIRQVANGLKRDVTLYMDAQELYLTALSLMTRASWLLCRVVSKFLPGPSMPLGEAEIQWNNRWKVLRRLGSPDQWEYAYFLEDSNANVGQVEREVPILLTTAKKYLEKVLTVPPASLSVELIQKDWNLHVQGLMKTCIANLVWMKMPRDKVLIDFRYHPHFFSLFVHKS